MESKKTLNQWETLRWYKLHLAADTVTHEVITTELTLSNISDGEVLPNLLKQTRRTILEILGDGACDIR